MKAEKIPDEVGDFSRFVICLSSSPETLSLFMQDQYEHIDGTIVAEKD